MVLIAEILGKDSFYSFVQKNRKQFYPRGFPTRIISTSNDTNTC